MEDEPRGVTPDRVEKSFASDGARAEGEGVAPAEAPSSPGTRAANGSAADSAIRRIVQLGSGEDRARGLQKPGA